MISESEITATIIVDGFLEDAILSINSILDNSGVPLFVLINGKQDFVDKFLEHG